MNNANNTTTMRLMMTATARNGQSYTALFTGESAFDAATEFETSYRAMGLRVTAKRI
jgi:hypothetical protein